MMSGPSGTRALASLLLGAAVAAAGGCGGSEDSSEHHPPDPSGVLEQLRSDHPGARIEQRDGRVVRVYGTPMALGATPRESADAFVRLYAGAVGAASDELRALDLTAHPAAVSPGSSSAGANTPAAPGMQPLMYDPTTGQYRFFLAKYAQYRDSLRVSNADLRVLVANAPGAPVLLAASTVKGLGGFKPIVTGRNIDLQKANDAVKNGSPRTDFKGAVLPAVDPGLSDVGSSELIIWAGPTGVAQTPRVAVTFVADNYANPAAPRPEKWRLFADAQSGDILHQESLIVFADVPGTVTGMVTSTAREMRCDAEVAMPFPFADVRILGGASAQADASGNFVIPNPGTSPVTVESRVAGFHFNVFDFQASRNEILQSTVTPPNPANFLHNPLASSEFLTGQANGYYHAAQVRDWVLSYHPTYPDVFAQRDFPVRVNEPNSQSSLCAGNAWYDGAAINFCASYNAPGSGQDYGNTAFASVSQHEYGHHLVEVAGSGQGEYGEGMGDVVAALVNDDPRLGLGFFASGCGAGDPTCCNTPLRSADNNCQYDAVNCSVCGTAGCGHCGSEIHACGELLSGAIWDLRQELGATDPAGALDIVSNLALNSILLHGGTSIDDQIVIDFLTLDDDDGNLDNGTPHWTEICTAFEAHGLDCPAEGTGLTVSPAAAFEFDGPAGGPFASPSTTYTVENLGGASIDYLVDTDAPWLTIVGGSGTLGSLDTAEVTVELNTEAEGLANGVYIADVVFTNVTLDVDVTRSVTLTVGRVSAVSWNLDTNPGFTMGTGWAWGVPSGGGGTIGTDNFGSPDPTSGFTGAAVLGYNLSGNYTASLGQRHLTTGAIDCSNLSNVSLRFQRWLCVEESLYDHAAVRVSTDLVNWTDVWTNAQTLNGGYWTTQDLDISAVADGQPTVYVRWTMGTTDSAWQYCGWNLDDIEIWGIPDPDCTDDAECSDGLFCNGNELCVAGTCETGTAPDCGDGVDCTADSCEEATDTCGHVGNDGLCGNGLYCDGTETCHAVLGCQAGTAPDCSDGVSCTTDVCEEATDTCNHVPDAGLCSDGLYCNGAETCDGVLGCQAGTAPDCGDGVDCTVDVCEEATDTCGHVGNDGLCGNGLYCDGTETCHAVLGCQAGTAPDCSDGVSCTTDVCEEATDTCNHVPDAGLCSDGLYCNGAETCDGVLGCQAGTAPDCGDGVDCTVDGCEEETDTCGHVGNDGLCGNGLYCDGTETCHSVLGCQAGTAPDCSDGVSCTDDVCEEATDTCNHVPDAGLCSDGLYCNGVETCDAVLGCQAGGDPCGGTSCDEASDACVSAGPTAQLETATVLVGSTPVAVSLTNVYVSPVVVTSVKYSNNTEPVVTRIGNVTASGFEIYLQSPYGGAVVADSVSYLVVEEGVWNIDGVAIEAHQYLSTVTDTSTSAVGQLQTYGQAYVSPVVLGQVMSTNDPGWSMFWCSGNALTAPPLATELRTGKRVDGDPDTSRADEVVGYVVMEAGHGTIAGVAFEARVGGDTVRGVGDAPPYKYAFSAAFDGAPQVAVVTEAGRDGTDGGWAYTFGASPVTSTTLALAIDDVGVTGRNHTTEQVGYAVFEVPFAYPVCSGDTACDDGQYCNGAETCDGALGCQAGVDPCGGASCDEASDTCDVPPTAQLETATVLVGSTPVAVSLTNVYVSPVVVTSVKYSNNTVPVVTRIGNVTASGFEIYLQSPYGGAVVADTVNYLVVEEGVWNVDGVAIEAHKYLSTVTDTSTSAVGQLQTYGQAYVSPVVLGQVMSINDPGWSMFWCSGNALTAPPLATELRTGKRVDGDPDTSRADEVVGYVVMEAGHGTIGGVAFEARVGGDTVRGVGDAPPYKYTFSAAFDGAPQVAVVTEAGRDGTDGGWAYTFGASPVTSTTLALAIDDVGVTGRNHTTEQVGYAVFEVPFAYPVCSGDTACDDGQYCNGAETCDAALGCQAGVDPCGGASCDEASDACVSAGPTAQLETATVLVGSTPVAVSLTNVYVSPVVVTSVKYSNNTEPVVTRIGNVTASGFEIYLQSPYGGAVVADTVNYLVVEEGVWNIDGVAIEAHQYLSTVTDTSTSAVGQLQTYGQAYVSPVVLGQVMSTNDPGWSMFWCSGNAVTAPPSSTALRTGKRVDDDPNSTRADEVVGYVVMEAGHGTLGGVAFEARVGKDTVRGVVDSPPYAYAFAVAFAGVPQIAVVTQAGRDGSEGGWAYTFGPSPATSTTIGLALDDVGATGRSHTTEQVGYTVFESPVVVPVL